jgi:hypothetical protein
MFVTETLKSFGVGRTNPHVGGSRSAKREWRRHVPRFNERYFFRFDSRFISSRALAVRLKNPARVLRVRVRFVFC